MFVLLCQSDTESTEDDDSWSDDKIKKSKTTKTKTPANKRAKTDASVSKKRAEVTIGKMRFLLMFL